MGGTLAVEVTFPDGETTAVALVVAPDRLEEAVAALDDDALTGVLYWLDRVLERAHAARRAVLTAAAVALANGKIDPRLEANGHRYELRREDRTAWENIGSLLRLLRHVHGIEDSLLDDAVSEMRITDIRKAISTIEDADLRRDALDTVEQHRTRKPGTLALVDLDDPHRRR